MTGNVITFRTENPPPYVIAMRDVAKQIAKTQRKDPGSCYLHIKDWQRYRGYTTVQAAALIGVTPVSYRNWSDNRHWPNSIHLSRMAEAFSCSIEELYFPPPGMRQ